jgi:6-phosphogluconolactonase
VKVLAERMLVFIGSNAEASDNGLYVYSFDEHKGELTLLDQVSGLKNPTFLNLDVSRLKLYSIAEGISDNRKIMAEVVSFSIDPSKGTIKELNRSVTVDAPACHIQRDANDKYLIITSYHGGKIGLVALLEDGRIGALLDVRQHEGQSVRPERQNQPHPHSAFFSPDNRYLLVPDLGLDRIRAYTFDPTGNLLQFHGDTKTNPGAGPRHMVFHPNGKFAFVINEIDSTITSFRYDSGAGQLHTVETVTTLPPDFQGENWCAEITVSENGNFLYGSNRGHDSIVVFTVDPDSGRLSFVEHVSTEGQHPRHFALTPGCRFLIAANRDTNNIVIFQVDQMTGKLQLTGQSVQVSKPVCVQAAYFSV